MQQNEMQKVGLISVHIRNRFKTAALRIESRPYFILSIFLLAFKDKFQGIDVRLFAIYKPFML